MTASASLLARVRSCGSSFYWGIRLLPWERRLAMGALYLYCRAVDDIVDAPGPAETKAAALEQWRSCLADPRTLCPDPQLGAALAEAMDAFDLPMAPFHAIIDGMAMDLPPGCIAPDEATLSLYCDRVAGAVGLLSVRIFGCQGGTADAFALATGQALQITNILRDVAEDAAIDRLYLPRELLLRAGITALDDPAAVLRHPAIPGILNILAERAEAKYEEAIALARSPALSREERRLLRPGLVMLSLYRLLLRRLQDRGWDDLSQRPSLGRLQVLGTILRWRLLGA